MVACISVYAAEKSSNNCRVNDTDISGIYSGECVGGLAHGKGIAVGRDKYDGEFINGNKHGQGTYTWGGNSEFAGQIFVGKSINDEFVKGVWNYSKENIIFEGTFKSGKLDGFGSYKHSDGSIEEGNFSNGELNGAGVHRFPDGSIVKGNFLKGALEGIATINVPKALLPDQKETTKAKLIDNYWVIQVVFKNGELLPDNTENKLSAFEKYQIAYIEAWYSCALAQKQVFQTKKAKASGINLNENKTDSDVSEYIKTGLAKLKKEYDNIKLFVSNPNSNMIIQEHYEAAIKHVKETHLLRNEDFITYTKRMKENERVTDQLWDQFKKAEAISSVVHTDEVSEIYTNLETNIKFPPKLSGWTRSDIKLFPLKQAGVQIDYLRAGSAKTSIYIYNGGIADIPTGIDSEVIKSVFEVSQKEILNLVDSGKYNKVQKLQDSTQILTIDNNTVKALVSQYRITGTENLQQPIFSWIILTGYKGHFLKIRCTRNDIETIEKGQEELKSLIAELLKSK